MLPTFPRGRFLAFLLLILWPASACQAQEGEGSRNAPAPTLVLQNLGVGALPLDGPWQFQTGDNLAWAEPAFGDSNWEQISANRSWGEQSHPSYSGFAWYRRHITFSGPVSGLVSSPVSDLAIMVRHVDDVYAIYWNGRPLGRNGEFPPHAVWFPLSQPPQIFALPSTAAAQSGVLAVRVWKAPFLSDDSGKRGGFSSAPIAGTSEAVIAAKTKLDYEWLRSRQFLFGEDLLYALVAVLSFLAWLRDRHQWPLLWVSAFAFASILRFVVFGLGIPWPMTIADGVAAPVSSLRDISLWFLLLTLLQLREKRGLVLLTRVFACVSLTATTGDGLVSIFGWTSRWIVLTQIADASLTGLYILTASLPLVLVLFAFSRRRRLDATARLVAILAFLSGMLQVAQNIAPQGNRFTHWTLADKIGAPLFIVNGNSISIVAISSTLLLLSIVLAVYRNSLESRRRQIALEQEFRSAQELQRALIPEMQELQGFAFTSSYLPAAEVGGDFFQLVPAEGNCAGSTLVVIGDVSGKGLKAAMSVALIVGAIRTLVEISSSPSEILAGINRRVCGRLQDGFVTCLILRLDPDGTCVMANAGHPPPFLNDREMEAPGALPLGLISDLGYAEHRTRLKQNDHLTLYTDGLLEARNPVGELFGFERMHALFATKPSAAEAAQIAVDFGQDDDITVLTLTRTQVA
jgi:hypothetical protein